MAPSSPRGNAPVIWVAVHTMEGVTDADDAAAFFHRSTQSSAHAVADDTELIEGVVPYNRAAWTLRGGNPISDNLELCAFADMSRAQWLSKEDVTFYNPSLRKTVTARRPYYQLVHTANWIRSRCQTRGIPMHKISSADVAANRPGVIGHINYTEGKKDGTHWDPGPGFPWNVVMALANGEEEMTTPQEVWAHPIPVRDANPPHTVSAAENLMHTNYAVWRILAAVGELTDDEADLLAVIKDTSDANTAKVLDMISHLTPGSGNPIELAALLAEILGPELAAQTAAELSKRLAG